jgi:hypothetical protein
MEVWRKAEMGITVFLVHKVEGEVAVAMVGMVYLMPVCDFCEEGTWVGCERVECEAVEGYEEGLWRDLVSWRTRTKTR